MGMSLCSRRGRRSSVSWTAMLYLRVLRRRAGLRVLLLALTVALTAVAVTDLAQGKAPAGPSPKPTATVPGDPPGAAKGKPPGGSGRRYRIVGCVSHGLA